MKYEIFSHKVVVDEETYNTHGIVVTDQEQNTYVFDDVTTFKKELEGFVSFLNEENVSLNCFKIFLELFNERF